MQSKMSPGSRHSCCVAFGAREENGPSSRPSLISSRSRPAEAFPAAKANGSRRPYCARSTVGRCHGGSDRLDGLPLLRREPINQRQPVETFPESAREIIDPALPARSAPLPDLLHGHAQNQNLMHQRSANGAEFALGAVQPQHGLALAFRNRFPRLPAVDIFPRGIDRLWAALGFLPIVLESPPALVLRLVDLAVRVQPRQGVIADRA